MYCPTCKIEINNEKICPKCSENIFVIKKCISLSNKLYNKGLKNTKLKNYSDAICSLSKSVYINKYNTDARNLLGLIYLYIGNVGDAIKCFIISSNMDNSKDNIANIYIQNFQDNIRTYEIMSNSINLYNQAINNLKNKNDDLAIIGLKKALSAVPNFIEAMNLLVFCYISQDKYEDALKIVLDILEIDTGNEKAQYYKLLLNEKVKDKNNYTKKLNIKGNLQTNILKTKTISIYIVTFIIALVSIILTVNYVKTVISKKDIEILTIKQENIKLNDKFKQNNNEIKALQEENENLSIQIKDYLNQINKQNNTKIIKKL